MCFLKVSGGIARLKSVGFRVKLQTRQNFAGFGFRVYKKR